MTIRYSALDAIEAVLPVADRFPTLGPLPKASDHFGENVFHLTAMRDYLSESAYLEMQAAIQHGQTVSGQTAEAVAEGLLKWATDRGATHFTHWFQPLTGGVAEKHDSFYKPAIVPGELGIEAFSAAELLQREPDASSFPHGGMRGTEAARGYTLWDPSSPAFLLETRNGRTLHLPAVFVSYTGEALDHKAPLLRSIERLNVAATAVCHYFDPEVRRVAATLGWEQEYFVVDKKLYNARPDLVLTGRTLLGAPSPRGQQFEDHYFAAIPERIQHFMVDFEREAGRVGIPITTRHNEVAPGQYECAPMFEELNPAVDHNLLLMDVMQRVADRHDLRVLFHEKPFAGVNGSGKHNNWSLATNKGKNLLSPGKDPGTNLQFLTFFVNVLQALNRHEAVLRAAIATAGNEHRLGANEAPPAIISAFTGSHLEEVLHRFVQHGPTSVAAATDDRELGIRGIAPLALDATDRNRTSPFPFTGNKFEFRAVGGGASCSPAMTALNVMVADQLVAFKVAVDGRVERGATIEEALVAELRVQAADALRIVFNGDNYSADWYAEAGRRGLSRHATTPQALAPLATAEVRDLYARHGIFSARELDARLHIQLETYIKVLDLEARTLDQLLDSHVYPAVNAYLDGQQAQALRFADLGMTDAADHVKARLGHVFGLLRETQELEHRLHLETEAAHHLPTPAAVADAFAETVKPLGEEIRRRVDQLELLVEDGQWHLPKYRELLFLR